MRITSPRGARVAVARSIRSPRRPRRDVAVPAMLSYKLYEVVGCRFRVIGIEPAPAVEEHRPRKFRYGAMA